YRVGSTFVPRGLHSLLSRQHFDELMQLAAQKSPAALDVPDQRVRLVLRQHADLANARIHAIGQREINDAEFAAEGHRRLGPPVSELLESRTASACQNKRQRVAGQTADETSRAGSCHFDCPPCVNEVEPCARAFALCNLPAN